MPSVVPSHTHSPTRSVGTIPSQRSNGSGSGSRHGSASTVFIPADEDVPDTGSTISSLTRSSFRSVPMGSLYRSDSFHSTRQPHSIDDTSLPSHGQEFLSPSDACIAIALSRSSSASYKFYDGFGRICQCGRSSLGDLRKHFRFRNAPLAIP
jgi:hypothetical protein